LLLNAEVSHDLQELHGTDTGSGGDFSDCEQAAPPPGGGFFKPQVGGFQGGNFQGNKTRT